MVKLIKNIDFQNIKLNVSMNNTNIFCIVLKNSL